MAVAVAVAAPCSAAPQVGDGRVATTVPIPFNGPPAPVPPAVAARDASGRTTLRAVWLEEALDIDGRIDEAVCRFTLSIEDFVQ